MKSWKKSAVLGLLLMFVFSLSGCFAEDLSNEEGVLEGKKFTSFAIINLNREKQVIQFEGKPMVLNFWATWCPACQSEMGELQKFKDLHPEVMLHLVSIGETPDEIQNFLTEQGLNLDAVIDPTGKGAQLYRVTAIPTTLVVDKTGMIVFRKVGAITEEELAKALGI